MVFRSRQEGQKGKRAWLFGCAAHGDLEGTSVAPDGPAGQPVSIHETEWLSAGCGLDWPEILCPGMHGAPCLCDDCGNASVRLCT